MNKNSILLQYYRSQECQTLAYSRSIIETNAKMKKSGTYGISLLPHFQGTCTHAGACALSCIDQSGVAQMMKKAHENLTPVDKARAQRTWLWFNDKEHFKKVVHAEVNLLEAKGLLKSIRPNVYSEIIELFDYVNYITAGRAFTYDYHKNPDRIGDDRNLIYSWNEKSNDETIRKLLRHQHPVAVVLPKKEKEAWLGTDHNLYNYCDGDLSDLEVFRLEQDGRIPVSLLSSKALAGGKRSNAFLDSWEALR